MNPRPTQQGDEQERADEDEPLHDLNEKRRAENRAVHVENRDFALCSHVHMLSNAKGLANAQK